jgi:hypothetical protein
MAFAKVNGLGLIRRRPQHRSFDGRDSVNRFRDTDLKEIRDMLDKGLNLIRSVDRVEKMRMRKRIYDQVELLAEFKKPTVKQIYARLEEKLSDVFDLYPYGFCEDFKKLLLKKTAPFGAFMEG